MTELVTKLLIANRGEIAERVMRTCRALNIRTVAVYSEADRNLPFVAVADEAVCIGPAAASASYLSVDKILDAARRTGADSVHPGYGFLAENAAFAEACAAAGLTFLGPSPAAIRAMGQKREAKQIAANAGVPVIPGYAGADQTDATLIAEAKNIPLPLLVKASAGGGGKGMRVVRSLDDLPAALASARREAKGAFGDDTLLLERYIENPRHIEIQIVGDTHGNVVHRFDRECSIQRRHQKIIEEAPSAAVSDPTRAEMIAAATRLAEAIGYHGVGTVEMILAPDGAFYFLEVNTRLQVEHGVTEALTGIDLVHDQIRVARGESLAVMGDLASYPRRSIECRIYAEDTGRGYLPSTGTLLDWHLPPGLEGVRVDSGVRTGSVVGIDYDPMLAKVIATAPTRQGAIRKLVDALERFSILGVTTNRAMLLATLAHSDFVGGTFDTGFVDTNPEVATARPTARAIEIALVAATIAAHHARRTAYPAAVRVGYRNNRFAPERVGYTVGPVDHEVCYVAEPDGTLSLSLGQSTAPDAPAEVGPSTGPTQRARPGQATTTHGPSRRVRAIEVALPSVSFELDGVRASARIVRDGHRWYCHSLAGAVAIEEIPRFVEPGSVVTVGGCVAPMPGKVLEVRVAVGDQVEVGDVLVVLEAMKMEHSVTAPTAGTVKALSAAVGAQVDADAVLVILD